jgi:hypothetical protein
VARPPTEARAFLAHCLTSFHLGAKLDPSQHHHIGNIRMSKQSGPEVTAIRSLGALTAMCVGGILEMTGGAPPDEWAIKLASACFALAIPCLAFAIFLVMVHEEDQDDFIKKSRGFDVSAATGSILALVGLTGVFSIFQYLLAFHLYHYQYYLLLYQCIYQN